MATLLTQFAQLARVSPLRSAIETSDRAWNYVELMRRASWVGRGIQQHLGRKASAVVAIYCRHSEESIAALLGSLWANQIVCCIPTDVSVDETRRILRHSQARLVLTDDGLKQRALDAVSMGQTVVGVPQIEHEPQTARFSLINSSPWRSAQPQDPAVIIYTSGSSGQPKGVLHSHRSLVQNARHHVQSLGLRAGEREVWTASLSTISGFTDLFRNLYSGGSVVPIDLSSQSLVRTAKAIRAANPHRVHLVPTVFRRLAVSRDQTFSTLRLLHLGGEPVTRFDLELFKQVTPNDCVLLNNYGCSEVPTIRQGLFDHTSEVSTERLPLNQAVPGKEVRLQSRVLEVGLHDTPPQSGEIVVRSKFTALGYWRDSKRSRKSFSRRSEEGESVEFQTGDYGVLNTEDALLHLGRLDRQVKINGRKVDLAAIESTLRSHPRLSEVAIDTLQTPLTTQLVAHCVVDQPGEKEFDPKAIIDWLEQQVDRRMVPHRWIRHSELPTLPNGKINRQALRQSQDDGDETVKCGSPQPGAEMRMSQLWQEVLNKSLQAMPVEINLNASFFALGGDSLAASDLARRVSREFGRPMDVASVFRYPTLEDMLDFVNGKSKPTTQHEYLDARLRSASMPTIYCVGDHRPLGLIRSHFGEAINTCSLMVDGIQTARFRGLSADAMVEEFVANLTERKLPAPDVLVGFSYGGLLAAGLATRLDQTLAPVPKLLLLEPSIPGRPASQSWVDRIIRKGTKPKKTGEDSTTAFDECLPVIRRNIVNFRPALIPSQVAIYGSSRYLAKAVLGWGPYFPRAEWHPIETDGDHLRTIQPKLAAGWLDRLTQWIKNVDCKVSEKSSDHAS